MPHLACSHICTAQHQRTMQRFTQAFRRIASYHQPTSHYVRKLSTSAAAALPNTHPITAEPSTTPLRPEFGGDLRGLVYDNFSTMTPMKTIPLPGQIFNAPIRVDLVHRVVTWQLACRRAGTASTKSRSEVAGSGRKIRPQKGTGRSRQGARTSPIFRGGGRAHGPKPRDWSYELPRNVRRSALRSVISSKLKCGQLWIVNDVSVEDSKTAMCLKYFRNLGWTSVMVVDNEPECESGVNASLLRASSTIQRVLPINVGGLNCYDALHFDVLVLSQNALTCLIDRFNKYRCFV